MNAVGFLMSLCMLCNSAIIKNGDKNVIIGRSEFNVKAEISTLQFTVDISRSVYICKVAFQNWRKEELSFQTCEMWIRRCGRVILPLVAVDLNCLQTRPLRLVLARSLKAMRAMCSLQSVLHSRVDDLQSLKPSESRLCLRHEQRTSSKRVYSCHFPNPKSWWFASQCTRRYSSRDRRSGRS